MLLSEAVLIMVLLGFSAPVPRRRRSLFHDVSWSSPRTERYANNIVYQSYAHQWNALCDKVVVWDRYRPDNTSPPDTVPPVAPTNCKIDASRISCLAETCP